MRDGARRALRRSKRRLEAGLEILRHSLYRYRRPTDEVDQFVSRLREHLSFTLDPDVEDILPPEGLGPAQEVRDGAEPSAEGPAPQSSDDD